MKNEYAIAVDIGGHFIKSAVINKSGAISKDTMMIYPSHAHMHKDPWLEHLTRVIQMQASKIIDKRFQLQGIGFAFPDRLITSMASPIFAGCKSSSLFMA